MMRSRELRISVAIIISAIPVESGLIDRPHGIVSRKRPAVVCDPRNEELGTFFGQFFDCRNWASQIGADRNNPIPYTKVSFANLYDRKTPITAADLLNDRVLRFFEEHDVKLLRVLTDRGSEFCGNPERHEYELYLAVEDIDHSRTKTKSPQTNGICERFHKTALNEFYRVAFRKKVYRSTDELQADLDAWIKEYNEARPHQGRWCFGKTPMQTFLDAMPMTKEKMIAA